MNTLDSKEEIAKIDVANLVSSIEKLPEQIDQAWREVGKIELPLDYTRATNIIVSGMGGSALCGRVVDGLIAEKVRAPFEISTDFKLPNYVDENTLCVVSSYSGNTEETLESTATEFAESQGTKIFGITTGGKLAEFFKERKIPAYIFNPTANPSHQPRMSLGYSITALLRLLSLLQYISLAESEISSCIKFVGELNGDYGIDSPSENNLAKATAINLKGKMPVLISSGHLVGSAHVLKNQFNENAKTFANCYDLPEANHHLMEGLKNPAQLKELLYFLFFESELYSTDIIKRYPITAEVVEKNEIETSVYKMRGKSKLEQVYELLVFGSYVSYYLAILNNTNPTPIPWVDYFKSKLAE
jgi:glucose/mannose-6-phosphate isomerase